VADDEPGIRAVVGTLLQNAGYAVLLADGAEAAIALCEQHQAGVALLLTDVRMPKMNGLELADRILEREPRIRVLFMSGSDWGARRGFGCVAKPFTRG
jgi:two-component system, cell cycle sensor histidine kinase and response regulator CckA